MQLKFSLCFHIYRGSAHKISFFGASTATGRPESVQFVNPGLPGWAVGRRHSSASPGESRMVAWPGYSVFTFAFYHLPFAFWFSFTAWPSTFLVPKGNEPLTWSHPESAPAAAHLNGSTRPVCVNEILMAFGYR
jgi:hypothetical protein